MINLEFNRNTKEILVKEASHVTSLSNGFYGTMKKGIISLEPEEALYIMDIRNGACTDEALNRFTFNDLAQCFTHRKKFAARFLTYKDWRDKGLIARSIEDVESGYGRAPLKQYQKGEITFDRFTFEGLFYADDLLTTIDDELVGKELYERHWIGQHGTYKASHRGKISKLDIYETLFLMDKGILKLKNATYKEVHAAASERINYFDDLYSVYTEWRSKGYVVKSGFKFGTHFRIYLPGASPIKDQDEWIHSKHVLHVFSRKEKMIISEWARAIRVAHSVKKTFILAIPGKKKEAKKTKKLMLDFLLYHRKNDGIENPKTGKPRYLMYSLSEDEYIGGEELAKALSQCTDVGLEMMMAIADRESSITYYQIKRIELAKSEYEYFEIEWLQP